MIPVRYKAGEPRVVSTKTIEHDHPLYGTTCPACDRPFWNGSLGIDRFPGPVAVALVYIGPGDDPTPTAIATTTLTALREAGWRLIPPARTATSPETPCMDEDK